MKVAPGTRAVAALEDLPPAEARLVQYLRDWCDGPDGQIAVWSDIASHQGRRQGRVTLRAFEDLLGLVLSASRRPLMRHGRACACVGADEAVFAHFVTVSATGEREDAMLIATLLVRPDAAPIAASLAQTLGLAMMRGRSAPAPLSTLPRGEGTQLH